MKKIILPFLLAAMWACSSQPEKFVVTGNISGAEQGMARIKAFLGEDYVYLDSVQFTGGQFVLEGAVEFPTYAYLEIEGMRGPVGFFLENDSIFITVDAFNPGSLTVEGSVLQQELKNLYAALETEQNELMTSYRAASMAGDTATANSLIPRFNELYTQREEITQKYIDENKSSALTPYLIRSNSLYSLGWQELDSLVATLDPSLDASPYTRFFRLRIETLKKVDIGQPAPDFTQPDTSGNPLSLSSLIGKSELLLVDFWASWCGPCRMENPNIVAIYQDYHDKGFDVLGVSLDRPGEAGRWKEAIRNDNLTWHHMSDLQYWSNQAAKLYGVMGIPHSVLLDKNGIIIAKNLRGEELRKKVAEILG